MQIVLLIPLMWHFAVLGGLVALLAVLVVAAIRRGIVPGPIRPDHWRWSETAVIVVTVGFACLLVASMALKWF